MKHQKRSLFCLFCLFLFLTALCTVSADIGPKDQLTVYLTNPPQETYYLDLLWQPDTAGSFSNLSEEELAELDPALLSRLESEAPEGWAPAMVCGTPLPMWGDLVGHPQGDQRVHVFSYVGLPQVCRILLVTESGRQILTDPIERKVLQSSVTLDCASGRLYQSSPAVALGISFLATLLPTLLIEGLLLLLFGFSLRQNWKVFVLANLVTQIALTLIVHTTLLVSGNRFGSHGSLSDRAGDSGGRDDLLPAVPHRTEPRAPDRLWHLCQSGQLARWFLLAGNPV